MAKRRSAADYMSVIYAQDDFSEFLQFYGLPSFSHTVSLLSTTIYGFFVEFYSLIRCFLLDKTSFDGLSYFHAGRIRSIKQMFDDAGHLICTGLAGFRASILHQSRGQFAEGSVPYI